MQHMYDPFFCASVRQAYFQTLDTNLTASGLQADGKVKSIAANHSVFETLGKLKSIAASRLDAEMDMQQGENHRRCVLADKLSSTVPPYISMTSAPKLAKLLLASRSISKLLLASLCA